MEDEDQEEQVEHFDDFTLASSWERFISEIEAICRQWLTDSRKTLLEKGAIRLQSLKNFYKIKSDLKHAMKSYIMEFYFGSTDNVIIGDWSCAVHDLQLSFGVKEFLVIAPQSASGVLLDSPEASKLLSAVAIALSNCSSTWPAFVPVHDPSRQAYIGIQNMGTVFTRRFEADRIGSQVPLKLMHLEGLYELFVSKFTFSLLDFSTYYFNVHFTMKLTYKTLPRDHYDDNEIEEADHEISELGRTAEGETHVKLQWDDDCPWSEWYSAEDPVKGFELIAIWEEKTVERSLEMAELENASLNEAEKWFILPEFSSYLCDNDYKGNMVGFASQLRLLVNALFASLEAQFMEDFVSVENSGSDKSMSSAVIPPPTVLDRVLKDLFHEGVELKFAKGEHKNSRTIKAIAVLWIEFVREVRWCWEESQPLPRMPATGMVDLSTCLINQKLHMLAICLKKKRRQDHLNPGGTGNSTDDVPRAEEQIVVKKNLSQTQKASERFVGESDSLPILDGSKPTCDAVSPNVKPSDNARRGSAGVVVESMMLLNSQNYMHAPFTQEMPIMTEDMHEERLRAVEALGDSSSFSAQLERDILSSDMSAFKAANPDAVFEDFIRWHSPKDWETSTVDGTSESNVVEDFKGDWPPQGQLSERMSESGNSWRKMWDNVPPLPASEQKPLLDPNREGEKVLHYLETLRPYQLLEQMVCTAFGAAVDTLNQTTYGSLKQMATKVGQLYLTIASALKRLQANKFSGDTETTEDLRRLCVVFEHVEKLLTVAASLHRKFLLAPRLSEAIFSDFYDFYIPKMGIGSLKDSLNKEFEKKQEVRIQEREMAKSLFAPPSANQSWRKVLSMGNLLNGHEPVRREIIFSTRDTMSNSYHASRNPWSLDHEIETHRMYISGTSNDLRVALSVTSCD